MRAIFLEGINKKERRSQSRIGKRLSFLCNFLCGLPVSQEFRYFA